MNKTQKIYYQHLPETATISFFESMNQMRLLMVSPFDNRR